MKLRAKQVEIARAKEIVANNSNFMTSQSENQNSLLNLQKPVLLSEFHVIVCVFLRNDT